MSPTEKLTESPEHRRIVKALIDKLVKLGFSIIQADYDGHPAPERIGRHEPDVKAYKKNGEELVAIGEAKLCEDLDSQHTAEQFQDFSKQVMLEGKSKGKPVPFHIVVPKSCEDKLAEKLKELGLYNKPNITRWSWRSRKKAS